MEKSYRAELVGAFGCPIDENPTGVVEEAAFAAKGLNYRYLTVKVNDGDLEAAMNGVRAFNMRGINLTIPHKVKVLQYLDELSEAAELIGAVNMVVNNDGKLWGENTDGKGYLKSLTEAGVSLKGKNITILGAGGAARAISVECALAGAAHITVANIIREQGEELVDLLNRKTNTKADFVFWDHPLNVDPATDILSNATSVGLYPHVDQKPNINYDTVTSHMVVTDVIFNDPNSLFLQEAKKRGITVSCDLNYRKNLWKYARIRTTTGFAGGCVLLFFQSGVFCLCLAVQAAVCACRRVGQREYLRKLLFHGGYAARVFAVDDIFDPRRELELALFHLLAVLDEVHRNARVNIADHVPVQIQNAVNFDDVLAAKLIADNVFEQRHRAIELVKIQYLI